jgi:hypothetical protein
LLGRAEGAMETDIAAAERKGFTSLVSMMMEEAGILILSRLMRGKGENNDFSLACFESSTRDDFSRQPR